jgi:hypothetical protein
MVSEEKSEIIAQSKRLISIAINGKPVPFKLSAETPGLTKVQGSLPDLPDGKHTAVFESYDFNKRIVDRHKRLLFVDATPPIIELVEPVGPVSRVSPAMIFKVQDSEPGSGVISDPETSELAVTAGGANVTSQTFFLRNNRLHLQVNLKFNDSVASPGHRFNLDITVKDRAGNQGHFAQEFKTVDLLHPEYIGLCENNDTAIQRAGGFLVYPQEKKLILKSGESSPLSLVAYANYGQNYTYPAVCVKDYGKTAPEFSHLSAFFQNEISKRIEVIGSSGELLIEKATDKDLTDHITPFKVTQRTTGSMGNQMGFIHLRVPVSFALDTDTNYCPYDGYEKIPEHHFSYAFETLSVPVLMEVATQPIKMKIHQVDEHLEAHIKFNDVNLMDTAASWFETSGEKIWFETQGETSVARAEVQEGTLHYKVTATHRVAIQNASKADTMIDKQAFFHEGDFPVKMSPPVIKNFRYDRTANTVFASVEDKGTDVGRLKIKLGFSGYQLDYDLDAETGNIRAVLPFTPVSIFDITLQVTDLAGQTTSGKCKVLGNAESTSQSEPGGVPHTAYKSIPAALSAGGAGTGSVHIVGSAANGQYLAKICEASLQTGYYFGDTFVSLGAGSKHLVPLKMKGYQPPNNRNPSSILDNSGIQRPGVKVFLNHYDESLYEPDTRGSASLSLLVPGSSIAASKIYYVKGYYEGSRFYPANDFNIGLPFSTKEIKSCHTENIDMRSPVIQAEYDPLSGEVTGTIHDHGMPFSSIQVSFSAQNDSVKNQNAYHAFLPFEFKNGQFAGRFEPPPKGEHFTLVIRAIDPVGNTGTLSIGVTIPRLPPEVSVDVETERTDLIFSHPGDDSNTVINGTAIDDSSISAEQTTLWLDGQVLQPVSGKDTRPYTTRSVAFVHNNSKFQGTYASAIGEGVHQIKFRATDCAGLSAETVKRFEFNLAPVIQEFIILNDGFLNSGGPVFSALIIDRGNDLDVDGITLKLNGVPLDSNRLFYDPLSGYFAADGPLSLPDGGHTATLVVVDKRGNETESSIRFVRALQAITMPAQDAAAGLAIDGMSLMELGGHNGDGRANPGEFLRLLISLRNNSMFSQRGCQATLVSGDEDIVVSTYRVDYGNLDPDGVTMPLKGFEFKVEADVLTKTARDPYAANFDLVVNCSEDNHRIPLTLPIYRPSLPIDISSTVSVKLDDIPRSTTQSQFRLMGQVISSAAFIEDVVIRVNGSVIGPVNFRRDGGRFETLVELIQGYNDIEVQAMDKTGASDFASGIIFRAAAFVPPSVRITVPSNGSFFQCDNLNVSGTYSAGSSVIDKLEVKTPWSGRRGCLVTLVDSHNFSANCGQVTPIGGVYSIDVTLTTTGSMQARDSRSIIVGDCF